MDKQTAVIMAYQIATLSSPSDEVLRMLYELPYERALELLLVLRQSPREVKSPLNFLRRAIAEGWNPESLPERVNRKEQNEMASFYMEKKGMNRSEADARAREVQCKGVIRANA